MDMSTPKSRQELEAELACLKARLREYEAKEPLQQEGGGAVLQTIAGFANCQDRLKAKDSALCEAQDGLQRALSRYASLFDSSPTSYFQLDPQGIIRDVNISGASLLTNHAEMLLGQPFIAFIEPLGRSVFEHYLSQVFQGTPGSIELQLIPPGSSRLDLSLQISLVDDLDPHHGQLALVAAQDITPYKKAERALAIKTEQLARSNEDLERFAYVISHDLQEPLRNIGNYVQLLSRKYKGQLDDDADIFIGFATDGVSRLSNMIRELLSFSRITTQGQTPEPLDSGKALRDALANLESAINDSHAEICIEAMPHVLADRMQLVSLLQNLLGNALKYRSPDRKPEIRICVRPVNDNWLFSIADNGVGIESRQFERLFTLFHRIDPHGNVPGSGIGLAVCKRIVERHGGQIWVESTPGQGSVFYFTLEAAKTP